MVEKMEKRLLYVMIFLMLFSNLVINPLTGGEKFYNKNYSDSISRNEENQECKCNNFNVVQSQKDNIYYLGLLKDGKPLPQGKEFSGRIPTSWDWRKHNNKDWTTNVKNQGMCGSCYAFGLYSAMESGIKIKSNQPDLSIDLSEQFIVSCGTEWVSGIFGCGGAYFYSILEFIETYGAIPESCFPYVSGQGNSAPCSDKCDDWGKYTIYIDGWDTVYPSQTSIKNALIQYGPLITGMEIYENFLSYSNGIYEPSGDLLGYHLVNIVGYNDDQGYWICKNSWGISWGELGWFKIKYNVCGIEEETAYLEVQNESDFFEFIKCGTETYKRKGDIYNYDTCTISMSEHFWAGPARAWYRFDFNEQKVTDGLEIGLQFCDRSFSGNGPSLYVYLWDENKYISLGKNLGHWYNPKWIWIETYNSYKYFNNDGVIEIMIKTEDEDFTLLCNIGLRGKIAKPNLRCSGNLHFGLVVPGQTVVDNINVENIGDPGSELNWKVVDWPDWGGWGFSPLNGNKLTPEQGSRTIIVAITVPNGMKRYSGSIGIMNLDDNTDYEMVEISLSTSKNKFR
jgi:C1A family cysteine protease